jgi:predicted PurR-regulated permease PerM
MPSFNSRIRQVLLLGIIILLLILIIKELYVFLPGLLGAFTLYILSRENYFQLVYNKKWKRGWAAMLFVFYYLLLIGLPVFLAIVLISPKINAFLSDPQAMMESAKQSVALVQSKIGYKIFSEDSLAQAVQNVTAFIPTLLNSTANLITNLAIMLFVLYYMLHNCNDIEKTASDLIPLKQENIKKLASETKKMVKANAIGIPLISIIQGATAALGYFIFGVKDWALWGFLTGVFAFFPVVGTLIVYLPLVIYMYAAGETWQATAVLIYSVIVTGNVDYMSRITLLKRLADVHPVITILGVIVGLNLFGFVGLVFGPLLISYLILLFKIYRNEFIDEDAIQEIEVNPAVQEESDAGPPKS